MKTKLLSAQNVRGIGDYRKMFPLSGTHIVNFVDQIRAIGSDEFTLKEMAARFQTPIWMMGNHWKDNSEMAKLLRSLPGYDEANDRVRKMSVLALGFLWCQGDHFNQAELFFEFLNPPEENQCDKASPGRTKSGLLCLTPLQSSQQLRFHNATKNSSKVVIKTSKILCRRRGQILGRRKDQYSKKVQHCDFQQVHHLNADKRSTTARSRA